MKNALLLRDRTHLHRGIEQLFDELFDPFSGSLDRELEKRFDWAPAVDVDETDGHFLISLDLPGIKKEDVKIEVQDNQLVVSGERKEEKKESKKSSYLLERYYGGFRRSFILPSAVDADKIEANFEDGVLRIALPKSASAKARSVKIGEGKGGIFGKLLERKSEKAA